MIIPVMGVLAALLPAAFGGRLSRLAGLRLRGVWWLFAALGAQIAILEVFNDDGRPALLRVVHLGSYAVAGAFLFANRRLPGLWLLGIGAASNAITIAVNGGVLPASADAMRTAGIPVASGFMNSGPVTDPHLAFLGDVFAIPASIPLADVFSIGDVLIVLGVALASVRVCGTHWTRPWEPSPAAPVGRHRMTARERVLSAAHLPVPGL